MSRINYNISNSTFESIQCFSISVENNQIIFLINCLVNLLFKSILVNPVTNSTFAPQNMNGLFLNENKN